MNNIVDEHYTHIYPINDLVNHNLIGVECICNPTIDVDSSLVIHDALDGRKD